MTNGYALNHDKKLQIYFFCVKRQAKNDFLKAVESTVVFFCIYICCLFLFFIYFIFYGAGRERRITMNISSIIKVIERKKRRQSNFEK